MAGFDLPNLLLAVEAMVQTLPTIVSTQAEVSVGVPTTMPALLNVYITQGSATPEYLTETDSYRTPRVHISLAYRVAGNSRVAELAIAALIDELTAAVEANPTLGGMTDDPLTLDTSGADQADYRSEVGSEARVYPMVLSGRQQHT